MTMEGTSTPKATMPAVAPAGNMIPQQSVAQLSHVSPISAEHISSPHTAKREEKGEAHKANL